MKRTLRLAILIALSPAAVFSGGETLEPLSQKPTRVPGQIIVRFRTADALGLAPEDREESGGEWRRSPAGLRRLHRNKGLRRLKRIQARSADQAGPSLQQRLAARRQRAPEDGEARAAQASDLLKRTAVLTFDPTSDIDDLLSAYRQDPDVELVEADWVVTGQMTPNDPGFVYGYLGGLVKIQAPGAWDLSQGTGVVIAILDSGINYTHVDLAANIWVNADEIAGNGLDDDHNGYIDDVRGWDFTTCVARDATGACPTGNSKLPDNNPDDVYGHGTHVAGSVAAVGNNGIGVIGAAPRAILMPVRGLDNSNMGSISDLAAGLQYAADNGADVINNSWSGAGASSVIEAAINYAYGKGVVLVAAAGNNNQDASGYMPGRYANVITVSATDATDARASFSNFGAKIDLGAPGVGIFSTVIGNNYASKNGTSMACPHVAGVAALILSQHPDYTPDMVRQVLRLSADDAPPTGFDVNTGYGRLNALKALQLTLPPAAPATAQFVAPTKARSLTLSWSAVTSRTTEYRIDVSTNAGFTTFVAGYNNRNVGLITTTTVTGLTPNTTYFARVRAANSGSTSPSSPVAQTLTLGLPDLTVISFSATPASIKPSQAYTLAMTYKNIGNVAAASFPARFLKVGGTSLSYTVPALAAGVQSTTSTVGFAALTTEGTHAFEARVDPAGAVDELIETNNILFTTVTVDGTSPTLAVTSPLNGAVITGTVTVTATATDALSGLARVVFSVNGVDKSTDTASPYQFLWNTVPLANGAYTLGAKAVDKAGNELLKTVSVTLSQANGAQKTAGTTLPATLLQRQQLALSVTLKNVGTASWTAATGFQLGSINPADTLAWGINRVALASTDTIVPSASKVFTYTVTAPSTTGNYPLSYQMLKAGSPNVYFGQEAFAQSVTILPDTAPPGQPGSPALVGPSTTTVTLTWTASTDNVRIAGYWIDVSSNPSFATFATGYNNLSVGTALSRLVTGLTANTTYYGRVRAKDVNGLISANAATTARKTLSTPDITPPIVSLTSPVMGSTVTGTVTIQATATDAVNVAKVIFFVNGVAKTTDTIAPYAYAWNPAGLPNGPYVIKATAYDYANNNASTATNVTLTYDLTPPTAPTAVSWVFPATTSLTAQWNAGTDNVSVAGYRLDVARDAGFTTFVTGYNNRALGATVRSDTLTGLTANTTYYARVRSVDANGNISPNSAAVSRLTLATPDVTAPTVNLSNLVANQVVTGVKTVTATAADANGIPKVVFLVDGVVKATDTASPFSFAWDTNTLPTGSHTVQAVAYDPSNLTKTASVIVNVQRVVGAPEAVEAGPDEPLRLGDIYAYPHPLVNGGGTLHLEVGSADRVKMRIYTLTGDTVLEEEVSQMVMAPNGHLAHEYRWDTRGLASGTYYWWVEAEKNGETIRTIEKLAVVQ